MERSLSLVLALSVTLSGAACSSSSSSSGGGSTDGGGADSSSLDPATACADLAAAYCAKFESCGQIPFELLVGDAGGCKARAAATCVAALGANGTSATAASTESCAQTLSSQSCDDFFNGKQSAACTVKAGTLADGAACGDDAQCKSAFCGKMGGSYCGTCAAAPAAGAKCVGGRCGPGLACGANGNCVAPGDTGATCDANTPCKATLSCGGGKCTTPVATGATCDPKQMTTAGCDAAQGNYCNAITNKCTKAIVATTNQQCGVARGELTLCAADGFCRVPMNMTQGVCVAAAADGASCDAMTGPICMAGAHCVSGKCVADDPGSCK